MPKNDDYNRGDDLKKKFNEFLAVWSKKGAKLEENMTFEQLVLLKSALHNINNMATLKATESLAELLATIFNLSQDECEALKKGITKTKPNANGFDIEFSCDRVSFVAEVKCNMPINRDSKFGSQQRKGIKDDIEHLKHGKKKSKLFKNEKSLKNTYKFLGIYNDEEGRSEKAMQNLCGNLPSEKFTVDFFRGQKIKELDPGTIYIVMLGND